jgi:hypothetical protein
MDIDDEQTQAEQRDTPGGEEAQRSWASVLTTDANQVVVNVATAGVIYGAAKIAGKISKPPPPPPPSGDGKG